MDNADPDPEGPLLLPPDSNIPISASSGDPIAVPEAEMSSLPGSFEGPVAVPGTEMSCSPVAVTSPGSSEAHATFPDTRSTCSASPILFQDPPVVSEANTFRFVFTHSLSGSSGGSLVVPDADMSNVSVTPPTPLDASAPDAEMIPLVNNPETGGLGNTATASLSTRSFDDAFVSDLDTVITAPPRSEVGLSSKVRVQEVDYSSTIRHSLYSLRSRFRGQLSRIKIQEQSIRLLWSRHDSSMSDLRKDIDSYRQHQESVKAELKQKDDVIAHQAEAIKKLQSGLSAITSSSQQTQMKEIDDTNLLIAHQADALEKLKQELYLAAKSSMETQEELARHLNRTLDRDSLMSVQSETLEKLKQDLLLEKESNAEKQEDLSRKLHKLAVEKESEFLALKEKNERIVKRLEERIAQMAAQSVMPRHTPDRKSPASGTNDLEEIARRVYLMLAASILPTATQSTSGLHAMSLPSAPLPPVPSSSGLHAIPLPSAPSPSDLPFATSPLASSSSRPAPASSFPVSPTSRPQPVASPTPRKRSRLSRKVQLLKLEIDSDKERNINLEHIRHLFEVVFDVSKDEDFLLASSPTPDQLRLFAETGTHGPDPFDLQWDFNRPASSDWNQIVIHLLLRRLSELRREEEWTSALRSDDYWVEAISQKFGRIRSLVVKCKPRLLNEGVAETREEVSDRLVQAKEESLRKARRDARRIWKYKHRVHTAETAFRLKTEQGDQEDAEVWSFLHTAITSLGTEGMSSDESGEDELEPVFLTRTMPWRREIKRELKIIDSCRLPGASPRGPKAAKRLKSSVPSSRRAVVGLPPQFYNTEWLGTNPHTASIEGEFLWKDILTRKA